MAVSGATVTTGIAFTFFLFFFQTCNFLFQVGVIYTFFLLTSLLFFISGRCNLHIFSSSFFAICLSNGHTGFIVWHFSFFFFCNNDVVRSVMFHLFDWCWCTYYISVFSQLCLLNSFQWITLATLLCYIIYFLCARSGRLRFIDKGRHVFSIYYFPGDICAQPRSCAAIMVLSVLQIAFLYPFP